MLYVGSFAVGLGPVFWLILSEIYPLRMRGRAMSVGTAVNWSSNLVVAVSFLTLTQILGKASDVLVIWSHHSRRMDLRFLSRARNEGKES